MDRRSGACWCSVPGPDATWVGATPHDLTDLQDRVNNSGNFYPLGASKAIYCFFSSFHSEKGARKGCPEKPRPNPTPTQPGKPAARMAIRDCSSWCPVYPPVWGVFHLPG